jgi:copper type II ascorbate-dependent monooxygenase-like protein
MARRGLAPGRAPRYRADVGRRRIGVVAAAAAIVVGAATFATASRGTHATAAPPASAATPTWQHVAPIFAQKCAGCHSLGGIAPFALTSARSAKAHARPIMRTTQSGAMPPWMPGSDSPQYLRQSERILTAAEKDLIARWVRGGARLGRGGTVRPAAPNAGGGTALTLSPRRAYMPRAAFGGMDDYHCFLMETNLARDVFVTGAVVRPQRSTIVHHVILFEATGGNLKEARRLDAASGGKGWTCFGGPGLEETHPSIDAATSDRLGAPPWIGAWVPGHTTNDTPNGTGVLLHAGSAVVMQVHYNLMHHAHPDRSRVVLRTVPAAGSGVTTLDTMLIPAPVELPCPAGINSPLCSRDRAVADEQRKYGAIAALIPLGLLYLCEKTLADYPQNVGNAKDISTSCDRAVNRPLTIYGVAGHMHTRGFDIQVELNPGTSRSQVLLHIPRWNFHWQDAYYLAEPVNAEPGDVIRVSCRYDNSAQNQPVVGTRRLAARYVLWGEGTTDEMCLGLLQVATRAR